MRSLAERIRRIPWLVAAATLALVLVPGAGDLPRATTESEDFPHGTLDKECSLCHSPDNWAPARISDSFDHSQSRFPLAGAHVTAACRSCHLSLDFAQADTDCASCHQDVHVGELGLDCERCHTTRNFTERAKVLRDHRLTRFPLTGAHAGADCESCHTSLSQGKLVFVNFTGFT
jgi:hypothetical protein